MLTMGVGAAVTAKGLTSDTFAKIDKKVSGMQYRLKEARTSLHTVSAAAASGSCVRAYIRHARM